MVKPLVVLSPFRILCGRITTYALFCIGTPPLWMLACVIAQSVDASGVIMALCVVAVLITSQTCVLCIKETFYARYAWLPKDRCQELADFFESCGDTDVEAYRLAVISRGRRFTCGEARKLMAYPDLKRKAQQAAASAAAQDEMFRAQCKRLYQA